jgi:hypothetical protein
MEVRDLLVGPLVFFLLLLGGYIIRPAVTDARTIKYFLPALAIRMIGALLVGLTYQFYYSGGDTFNFHTHGSRHIWDVFMESPTDGLQLIFGEVHNQPGMYVHASRILFFHDSSSYFVVRIAAFLDLFTFSSYVGTALLFSALSFVGSWMLFLTFYRRLPERHNLLALACLFIPSLFFWGAGLFKETLVLACLGMATYLVDAIVFRGDRSLSRILLLLIAIFVIFSVKKFVLQAFFPALILWVYLHYFSAIRSLALRILIFPLAIGFGIYLSYWSVYKVGEGDDRYAVDRLARTSQITAYDIGFYSGRDAGSRYTLGELDGTFGNMIELAPAAINVTLFRPYPWEIRNPLMALNAMESISFLALTLMVLISYGRRVWRNRVSPEGWFAIGFAMVFAFAIGISTYNFGTLARYKTPLLPYYAIGLIFFCKRPPEPDHGKELLDPVRY